MCESVRREEGQTQREPAGVSQTIVCAPNHSVCCLVSSLAIKYNKYSLSIVFGKIVFGFDKEPKSEKMNVSLIFGTFSLTN